MADSDDDWFEKDIDEFVVKAQPSNVEIISIGKALTKENTQTTPVNLFVDNEYGGCYNSPNANGNKSSSTKQGHDNNTGNNAAYIQPISFKKLSYILDQSPLNIFLDIVQTDSSFLETINRASISVEMVILTIKTILKFVETPFSEHIAVFLREVRKASSYWKQLEAMLKETTVAVAAQATNTKQKKKMNKVVLHKNDQELWQQIYNLCAAMNKHFLLPDGYITTILHIIEGNKNDNLNLTQFKLRFEQLASISSESAPKTDSCIHMDIYPTMTELREPVSDYVKPNLVKGSFSSVNHYLDVQLSLLREDFISPLRDGICELMKQADADPTAELKSNHNVRVYPTVRILIKQRENLNKPNFKTEYLMVDLEPNSRLDVISTDTMASNNNKYSKKLMYGSLLCLTTTTKFEDLVIAVVSNRDVDLLNQGYIQIEIIKSYNITSVFDKDFIMCESDVYFESYRHVYNALRSFTEQTFPMRKYIIDVDPTPHYPNYIPAKGKIAFTYRQHSLDLKNTSNWPTASAMKLNESQLTALKHSLTRQFSVVQGPPGCGKTFIGLQIIATLLMNIDSQILIVCYTNHALDQFLTGILKFTDSIVRVGNQSKSDALDCFNIKQLCENGITDKRVKTSLFKLKGAYAEAVQEFNDIQKHLANAKETDESIFQRYTVVQAKLQSIARMQEEMKQVGEYQLIKSKRIIGMTSTCAARCNALIHLLETPIVIFEEAAEILESHIVAALTSSVQHLILIGDHQQLRPTTSVYKLAQLYHMDISLFERMINNNLHSVTLTTQYRMRPEIANLIRPTIYKELEDNENVLHYPDVLGMNKNLFFIDHTNEESAESDETTKKNAYESLYLVALCNYLIIQGYRPEDITILTTYNGQIFQFAQDRKKYPNLRKVRITVVDNYQGEENKIILLSLVRSNATNNIGYLAFKNRICVALSRAKHGLYIIGNMSNLSKSSAIWRDILAELVKQRAIGSELELKCQTHQTLHKFSQPAYLDELKYGGCHSVCNEQLYCGHSCTMFCHTPKFEHFSDCGCNV